MLLVITAVTRTQLCVLSTEQFVDWLRANPWRAQAVADDFAGAAKCFLSDVVRPGL